MRRRMQPTMQGEWAPVETDVLRCQHWRMIGLSDRAFRIYMAMLGLSVHYRRDTHEMPWSRWLWEFGTKRRDRNVSYWDAITECTNSGLVCTNWVPNGSKTVPTGADLVQIVVAGLAVKWWSTIKRGEEILSKDTASVEKPPKTKTPAQIQNDLLIEALRSVWSQHCPRDPLPYPLAQKFAGQCARRDISPAWLARYVAGRRPVNPIAYAQRMLTGRERLEPNDPGSSWGRWVSDTLPAPKGLADIVAGVAGRWRVDE